MPLTIAIEPHPLLDVEMFEIRFDRSLSSIETPDVIERLCRSGTDSPLSVTDNVKSATRDLLRHTGDKPSGRSKPASEYLAAAVVGAPRSRSSMSIAVAWYRGLVELVSGASLHTVMSRQ